MVEDQNDTIKNESSPLLVSFPTARMPVIFFLFFFRDHKSVTTSCLRLSIGLLHKNKLRETRHGSEGQGHLLDSGKGVPPVSRFVISSALELALKPAAIHSGSPVLALLSTQCPRKASPVLRSTGAAGRGWNVSGPRHS